MAPPAPAPLQEIEVPSFFQCPISLDLMKDPVSLCTGMTYDRASIEKWLDDGNITCPATMQVLTNLDLVPNHTLRRLIQDWCVANRSKGVERIPTPRPPATPAMVRAMLDEIEGGGGNKLKTLRKLRLLYKESDKNRKVIEAAGALQRLTVLLSEQKSAHLWEEAVGLLALVPSFTENQRRALIGHKQLAVVAWILQHGGVEARVNAATLLEHIALGSDTPSSSGEQQVSSSRPSPSSASFDHIKIAVGSTQGVMPGLVQLLQQDQLYAKAVKSGLRCLLAVCAAKGNRVKAVEAGAVPALVDVLLHASAQPRDNSRGSARAANAEGAIAVLELLCSCAEGRAAVNAQAMAVPTLVTSLMSFSGTATECAVGAIWAICQFSPEYVNSDNVADVMELAVEAGLFTKLIIVMQADYSSVTKTKAAALMRQLGDVWSSSPCSSDHGLTHIRPY